MHNIISHLGRLDKTGGKLNGFAGAGALGAIGAGTTGALYWACAVLEVSWGLDLLVLTMMVNNKSGLVGGNPWPSIVGVNENQPIKGHKIMEKIENTCANVSEDVKSLHITKHYP